MCLQSGAVSSIVTTANLQIHEEESLMEENPYAPPRAAVSDVVSLESAPQVFFFAVSPLKLVVLSVCTLGLYQIYWFYKHWVLIKQRSEPLVIPWARAFFGFFWCYSCFEFIRNDERAINIEPTLLAGPLAIGWIVVSLAWRLPEPYFLMGFLAPLLLVPAQRHVNRINALVAPQHDGNSRFSGWNWLAVAVGGIFLGLMILGMTLKVAPHR
jgi:hypothetical protein